MFARRLLVVLALTAALPAPTAEAVPLAEEAVVGAYRPVVWLYQYEPYEPKAGGPFIAASGLAYLGPDSCRPNNLPGQGGIDQQRLGAGGYQVPCGGKSSKTNDAHAPFALDLADAARRGDHTRAPTYYEFFKGQAITFWFLYGFNQADGGNIGDHEGDWERVSFVLNAENRATSVVYYEHDYACTMDPGEVERDNGHPVVYSASGTHASYPWPENYRIYSKGPLNMPPPPNVQDHAGKGTRWEPPPIPVGHEPWFGYAGHWGNYKDGPEAPSNSRHGAPDRQWRTCECQHHFKSGCPFTTSP